jgi:TonB family protein
MGRGIVLLIGVLSLAPRLAAQPSDLLADVRSLYESASYEEALTRMASLEPAGRTTMLEQYRAFCLIALGRTEEAAQVIERTVQNNPDFVPSASDASPRVRAVFENTRRKLLPAIIKSAYASAKTSFSTGDFVLATTGFTRVLNLTNSLGSDAPPELADLKLVAKEFIDLSTQRMQAHTAAAADAAPSAMADRPAAAPVTTTPAAVLSQKLPVWTRRDGASGGPIPLNGEVLISIDETGHVVDARITRASDPNYDRQVLDAARQWRYTPATRNGVPLPSEKVISYVLRAR